MNTPHTRALGLRGKTAWLRAKLCPVRIRSATSLILPFNCDAPIRAYLSSAYPTGILTRERQLRGPILNHCIQLFFPEAKLSGDGSSGENHVRFLPGFDFEHVAHLGYLSMRAVPLSVFESEGGKTFTKRLIETLHRGIYIHAYVNKFFFPSEHFFLRRHFRHAALLVGFESASGSFIHAGYNRDGEFSLNRLPITLFLESLRLKKYGLQKPGATTVLEEIIPQTPTTGCINGELIRQQLAAYLRGTDNCGDYEAGGRFSVNGMAGLKLADGKGACGVQIYPSFRKYFHRVAPEPALLDLRATRTLLEHKQCILTVLTELAETKACEAEIREYRTVCEIAKKLHLTAFSAAHHRAPVPRELFSALIDRLESTEIKVLERFLGVANTR